MIKMLSSGKLGIKRRLKNEFKSGFILIAVNKKARLIKRTNPINIFSNSLLFPNNKIMNPINPIIKL